MQSGWERESETGRDRKKETESESIRNIEVEYTNQIIIYRMVRNFRTISNTEKKSF